LGPYRECWIRSKKFRCCAAGRDPETFQKTAETFVRFKEAVRQRREKVTEETLRGFLTVIAELRKEFDETERDLQLQSFQMPGWLRSVSEFNYEFSLWLDEAANKIKAMLNAQTQMPFNEFMDEMVKMLSPRLRSVFGTVSIAGNVLASACLTLLLVWICSFLDVDALENLKFPVQGWGATWLLWTLPHALTMFIIWNTDLFKAWRPLKGFRLAKTYAEFRNEIIYDPLWYGDGLLFVKALGISWAFTVFNQGVILGLLQGLLSGESNPDTINAGGFAFSSVPPLFRLPVELLMLSALGGVASVVADRSILIPAEDEIQANTEFTNIEIDPRIAAATFEDFKLLTDDQVTKQRAWFTFGYHFLNVGYLSIEAIAMKSLYTSMATLVIGYYLMLKGMQRKSS